MFRSTFAAVKPLPHQPHAHSQISHPFLSLGLHLIHDLLVLPQLTPLISNPCTNTLSQSPHYLQLKNSTPVKTPPLVRALTFTRLLICFLRAIVFDLQLPIKVHFQAFSPFKTISLSAFLYATLINIVHAVFSTFRVDFCTQRPFHFTLALLLSNIMITSLSDA
jgi:hypothetical protein